MWLNYDDFSVSDYEDQIQQREQDMDQQTQLVAELDSEVKRLQVRLQFTHYIIVSWLHFMN